LRGRHNLAPLPLIVAPPSFDLLVRLAWLTGLEMFGTYSALARANQGLETTMRADCNDLGCTATREQWRPGSAARLHGWFST